jgi:arylsulfatase A-like enzyme
MTLLAIISAALSFCCGGSGKPTNLIIIGIDTLRPDHLGCYGCRRATSPNIDKLGAGGALFLHTISQSSWTLPSFASLFTSLYPHQHGVASDLSRIKDTVPTMATILKECGYATGAIVNSNVLAPEMGLSRGFDFYSLVGRGARRADAITRDGLAWIDSQKTPFMLFLHYFDPHEPYAPPAPYDTLYDPGYRGTIGRAFIVDKVFPRVPGAALTRHVSATAEDWDHIKALYDGEITFTDQAIGDLLSGLAKRRLLGKTLIVLMGDHGEEFFEHGAFGHGHSLFGEVIRVPLIFSCPEAVPKGRKIAQQVRIIDIMPTVLDLLQVKTKSRFEGVSLLPLITGRGSIASGEGLLFPPELAYSEGILRGTAKFAITTSQWKIICEPGANKDIFFDLEQDPGEHRDLVGKRPEAYMSLSGVLLGALFSLTDSWYVEMADDGKGHTFGIDVVAGSGQFAGDIYLPRFVDETGHFVPADSAAPIPASGSSLHLDNLRPQRGRLTLAFKIEGTPALRVTLNFKLDGKPARDRTFVGDALKNPGSLPIQLRTGHVAPKAWGMPRQRPDPPYLLVWRVRGAQAQATPATLTEESKRELRALGYIQ